MKPVWQSLLFSKTTCVCGLATLALALAWPAHAADVSLIGQRPAWPRGIAQGVAVSGNYAYVAEATWPVTNNVGTLQVIDVSNPGHPRRVGGWTNATSGDHRY